MSTELAAKVKALIASKGGTPSEVEGLVASDIKQFVEIAQLYYGVLPSLTLIGLAYPDNIPANLKAALDGGSEEPDEDPAAEQPEGPAAEQTEDPVAEQPEDPVAEQPDEGDTSDTSGQDDTGTSDQGDSPDTPDEGGEDAPAEDPTV